MMLTPVWRQFYILSCILLQNMDIGFSLGLPAVLANVLTSNTTTSGDIHITREEASWITASYSITGPIGYLFIPTLMQMFGRRFIYMFMNIFMFIGAILIATAANFHTLVVGRAIQGIVYCKLQICTIILAEYCHPKQRGMYTVTKVIILYSSILLCHGLSAVLTWRQLSWISCLPSVFGLLAPLTWPDTPYWLAYKGRFQDCHNVFKLLRGTDEDAIKELDDLVFAQKTLKNQNLLRNSSKIFWVINAFRSREFLLPLGICATVVIILNSSGAFFLFAYIIEIMTEITGDKSQAFYFSLGVDLMKILACCAALPIIKKFPRRTVTIFGGGLSCTFLGLMCLLEYFNKCGIIDVLWLPASVLMLYCFFANISIIPVGAIIKGEIFPLEYKGLGGSAAGVLHCLGGFIGLKLTSNMMGALKIHGTFAVYLAILSSAVTLHYFITPETKDRTLQDIENEITGLRLTRNEKCDDDTIAEETTKTILLK